MNHSSGPSLDAALHAVRTEWEQLLTETGGVPDAPADRLLARLAEIASPDGSIPLRDGSRLHLVPEQGDRGGDTGRLGVVQRFADQRPERTHIVVARDGGR